MIGELLSDVGGKVGISWCFVVSEMVLDLRAGPRRGVLFSGRRMKGERLDVR